MKRLTLFFNLLLLVVALQAQLANTTWNVSQAGTVVGLVQFGGDGLVYLFEEVQFVAEATYTDAGNIFTTTDLPGIGACETPGIYTYLIIGDELQFTLVEDDCPGRVDLFTLLIWSAFSTVISEHTSSVMNLYPNPSDGEVYLEHDLGGTVIVKIFDMTGRLHSTTRTSTQLTLLELSQLTEGTYILEMITSKEHQLRKLILH